MTPSYEVIHHGSYLYKKKLEMTFPPFQDLDHEHLIHVDPDFARSQVLPASVVLFACHFSSSMLLTILNFKLRWRELIIFRSHFHLLVSLSKERWHIVKWILCDTLRRLLRFLICMQSALVSHITPSTASDFRFSDSLLIVWALFLIRLYLFLIGSDHSSFSNYDALIFLSHSF